MPRSRARWDDPLATLPCYIRVRPAIIGAPGATVATVAFDAGGARRRARLS